MNIQKMNELFENELAHYYKSNKEEKWLRLERLHVIGQQFLSKHFFVHFLMLKVAVVDTNWREILGQLFRLILVLPGHFFNRLPLGNIGSSRVSPFKKMNIPDDLKNYFEQS